MQNIQFLEYFQGFLAPATLLTVLGGFFYTGHKFGQIETRLDTMDSRFDRIEARMSRMERVIEQLNRCVNEIQHFLAGNFGVSFLEKTELLFGQAHSPLELKEEFLPIVKESGLEKEVKKNKQELINWLRSKKPKTGLDAQSLVANLVLSGQIEKFINTTVFKQFIYKNGRPHQDYYGILTMYLFGEIISPVIGA